MTGIAKFQRMNNVFMPGMVFKSYERLAIPGAWCNYLATKELQVIDFETRVEPAPVAIPVTQDSHYWILNHKLKVIFIIFQDTRGREFLPHECQANTAYQSIG